MSTMSFTVPARTPMAAAAGRFCSAELPRSAWKVKTDWRVLADAASVALALDCLPLSFFPCQGFSSASLGQVEMDFATIYILLSCASHARWDVYWSGNIMLRI